MQPASMNAHQFADVIKAKSCKVAAAYNESTLSNVFNGDENASLSHSLQIYWASHPLADLTYIVFHADFLLAIQKDSHNASHNNKFDISAKQYQENPWQRASTSSVSTSTTFSSARVTRSKLRAPPVFPIDSYHSQTTTLSANSTPFLSIPSIPLSKCDARYKASHATSTCPLLLRDTCIQIGTACVQNEKQPADVRPCKNDMRFFNRPKRS